MEKVYLAIENNLAIHERESRFWLSKNISSIRVASIRVASMNEAIMLARKRHFYYIGINASNVDYLPKLPLLRAVTNSPILVSTAKYNANEHSKALRSGADLWGMSFYFISTD